MTQERDDNPSWRAVSALEIKLFKVWGSIQSQTIRILGLLMKLNNKHLTTNVGCLALFLCRPAYPVK